MSLKCAKASCAGHELAEANQLAFYQDINNGGWNLALGPEYVIPQSQLPTNIFLVDSGDLRCPYSVCCSNCQGSVGKVTAICGFDQLTVNFSARKVRLLQSPQKWSKVIDQFPQIRKIIASTPTTVTPVGANTVHAADLNDLIKSGSEVASRSGLKPRPYQWKSFFFSGWNNTLLCLHTGLGKTLIASMLMKAYRQRNPTQAQVFIVPTVVLVEQQAAVIERHIGLKVVRRYGEEKNNLKWSSQEICVCTPAMLVVAIRKNEIVMSQFSLVVFDEVHEAYSPNSQYGILLPYISKCSPLQRPRVLGLTASPIGTNSGDMRASISTLCHNLDAKPFSPLVDTDSDNNTSCKFVIISKSPFEDHFESFVFESLKRLAQLHDYFTANWKDLPVNVPTKIKLNSVIKILSHAMNMAVHLDDHALLQLAQWMNKWVDSLNMLQIFGPYKLLQYIQDDLSFASRNAELSKVSPRLTTLLGSLNTAVDCMKQAYHVPTDSPRVDELLRQIKLHQSDQERILVFVERRDTAERLSRRLKEDPVVSTMHPEYVVGNSSGGFPKEIQQSVLEKFHSGDCQLLVATSVLEQGIDVAACSIVICFDGVKSTKSIIQSRGRARKKEAVFIAFVAADGLRKANELSQIEHTMNCTILQLMRECKSTFDPQLELKIQEFLDSDRDIPESSGDEDEIETEAESDEEDFYPESDKEAVTLRFFNFKNTEALSENIRRNFTSPLDRMKITKKLIIAQFKVHDKAVNVAKIIQKLSTPSDPTSALNLRTWIEPILPLSIEINQIDNPSTSLEFDALTTCHFQSYGTVTREPLIWSEKFAMEVNNQEIMLSNETSFFSIRPADVDGKILISDTKDEYEVFICLHHPPDFFIRSEKSYNRAPMDFTERSFNLCLKRNSAVEPEKSWKLYTTLQSFTLEVFNVCHLKQGSVEGGPKVQINGFKKILMVAAWHSKHAASLPPQLPNQVLSKFNECSIEELSVLLEVTVPIRFQELHLAPVGHFQLPFSDVIPPTNFAMIGRVKVTPSRFKFMPMLPMQKNRVFRYFPDPENFLALSFTDERERNPWQSINVYEWFLSVLKNGIEVGGKQFTFLGCSNSQLREGHCWFSSLDRQVVYDKIGEFDKGWNAGRKLTRIALAFASSIETVPLDHSLYLREVAPDVEVNGVNFSDGIGRASHDLFKRVKASMNLSESHISAFQIRVGGCKGVISLYDQQEDVTIRKSMKKFNSNHNMLEVLNYNRSIPLYLNRHIILLLSAFNVPNEVFIELQHNDMMKCLEALTDDKKALELVKSRSTIFDWQSYPEKQVVQEPIFRMILVKNIVEVISKIVDHAHIAVPGGRVLMGVLDETNTLEYGEIYAHIVEAGLDMELHGRVVVFRNPSVLPSDIRVLNGRNYNVDPRLRKLYQNCLVIPSRGRASHAHECSGGDLDGDLYYIIWDQRLVPDIDVPGEKVIDASTIKPASRHEANDDFAMMRFFCDYVSKSQLGMIANAHLATADQLGMRDPKTIQLARYVTAETDAPRLGLTVQFDFDLMPKEYPDYMRKNDRQSYRSTSVLGEMYRQARPLHEVSLEKCADIKPTWVGCISGTDTIEGHYSRYSYEINRILQSFELESEVDLFSGTPIWNKDYKSTYKQQNQLRETIVATMHDFWRKWQGIFEEWRGKVANDQPQINDWYCRPNHCHHPMHSFSILALPFIAHDLKDLGRKSIEDMIQESASQWIYQHKLKWLGEWRLRFNVGQSIMRKLKGIECHNFGSSMLGLSEEYSDINLYAADNDFVNIKDALKDIDENAISMKKPHACVSLTFDSLPVDVTNFIGGVPVTYALAEIFDENPEYWAALRVLVEWARTVRIIKSGGSQGIMTVVSFCHLFIAYVTKVPLRTTTQLKPYSLKRFITWIEPVNKSLCIFEFLRFIGSIRNKEWVTARMDPINGETLVKNDLFGELSKKAEVAVYILSLHDGDVKQLFRFCTTTRLFKIFKRYMNPKGMALEKEKQCIREIEMKCNPKRHKDLKFNLLVRNGCYYLEVTGDHTCFKDVELGLTKIHNKIMSARTSGLNKLQNYHIVNSTAIFPEYGNGLDTEVSFARYESESFMPQHVGMILSVMTFTHWEKNLNWRELEYHRYSQKFHTQMNLFKMKQNLAAHGSHWRFFGKMMCTIKCGNHYLFNIPTSLHNTFETVTLKHVELQICRLEETLCVEKQANIIRDDIDNYNSLTLLQSREEAEVKREPMLLKSLQDVKMRSSRLNVAKRVTVNKKKSNGIRNSFYTQWLHGLEKVKEFAARNGYHQTAILPEDYYTSISIYWRQREINVMCDKIGMMKELRHRATRWISSTFKRFEQNGGDDIRTYVETRAQLDDDESCLDTVIDFLDGRSVFSEAFVNQIMSISAAGDVEQQLFPSRPLIDEMFHLNWRFRSMRRHFPLLKFTNADNDLMILDEIHDGIFRVENNDFEWFPKHYEFEVRLCMDNRSNEELCNESFDMSLKLFDHTKKVA